MCLILLLVSACATKPISNHSTIPNNGVKLAPAKDDRINELLFFCDNYSNLTPEAQKKAFNETNQALAENKNDISHRIKLAIMLSIPSSRMRDTNKAQNLLQDLLQENSLNPSESAFSSLLYEYTLDTNKQLLKNREDAKKLELIQQKNEVLDLKLNELKNIEKTMNERDSKPVNKP
jgi:hypothetical protein